MGDGEDGSGTGRRFIAIWWRWGDSQEGTTQLSCESMDHLCSNIWIDSSRIYARAAGAAATRVHWRLLLKTPRSVAASPGLGNRRRSSSISRVETKRSNTIRYLLLAVNGLIFGSDVKITRCLLLLTCC